MIFIIIRNTIAIQPLVPAFNMESDSNETQYIPGLFFVRDLIFWIRVKKNYRICVFNACRVSNVAHFFTTIGQSAFFHRDKNYGRIPPQSRALCTCQAWPERIPLIPSARSHSGLLPKVHLWICDHYAAQTEICTHRLTPGSGFQPAIIVLRLFNPEYTGV